MIFIEEILHYLVDTIGVSSKDNTILNSFSRQCKKGVGLTDRQYDLLKNKLANYREELLEHKIVFMDQPTEIPLREIDRSKYIRIVDDVNPKEKWIEVRFPFSKKDIVKIDKIKSELNQHEYSHSTGSHKHSWKFSSLACYTVCKYFQTAMFKIDTVILEHSKQAENIVNNFVDYQPLLTLDNKLKNISITPRDNYLQNVDRGIMNGYAIHREIPQGLTETIAYRSTSDIYIDPDVWNLSEVINSLQQLDRFPLVVLIDSDDSYRQVLDVHSKLTFIPDSQQSILFRASDSKNAILNTYVKGKLNNWVDNNTKVVYISKSKLPKLLLKTEYKPICSLAITSQRLSNTLESYVIFNCDCIIYTDKIKNNFYRRYTNLAGMQTYN